MLEVIKARRFRRLHSSSSTSNQVLGSSLFDLTFFSILELKFFRILEKLIKLILGYFRNFIYIIPIIIFHMGSRNYNLAHKSLDMLIRMYR